MNLLPLTVHLIFKVCTTSNKELKGGYNFSSHSQNISYTIKENKLEYDMPYINYKDEINNKGKEFIFNLEIIKNISISVIDVYLFINGSKNMLV